jgi:hypothetical protein
MSSKHSSSSSIPVKPSNIALVESLIGHIDDFQNGTANEQTYLLAMNALRDLHNYVQKTENAKNAKKVARNSSVIVLIDGEEFLIEDFETIRIAVRVSDNYAYSSDTGDFLGVWNEQSRTLQDV